MMYPFSDRTTVIKKTLTCGKGWVRCLAAACLFLAFCLVSTHVIGKTITVGAAGCDYRTINRAIQAATAGDTISVAPGTYNEHIDFPEGITLQGAGRDVTVIRYGGDAPVITAEIVTSGVLDGFTIEYAGNKENCAIWLAGSSITVSNCTITGALLSGVEIGYLANPVIEGNIIRNNQKNGIYVHSLASGLVRHNEIYENGTRGIVLREGANTLIESNTIFSNTRDGILAYGLATPTIRNNIIAQNGDDGIDTTLSDKYNGNPRLSHNNAWNNHGQDYEGIPKPASDISADPRFVDPEHHDFRLRSTSPCIGSGEGGIDIGAHPYQPSKQPPQITAVEFPGIVEMDEETRGLIRFFDPDADLVQAVFEVLEGTLQGFTQDLTQPPYADAVRGKIEGEFGFSLTISDTARVRIRVILIDESGLSSDPFEFAAEVGRPLLPVITSVVFPPAITVNRAQKGLVKFEDLDGDIVQAQFEILEGDPAAIAIEPGMSFDPGISGQTKGAFRFSVQVTQTQTVKLRLTLTDSKGLVSEPHEFTFDVE
jgi:parallel beta-helix repeat protein